MSKKIGAHLNEQGLVEADGLIYKTAAGAFGYSAVAAAGATGSATGSVSGITYLCQDDLALTLTDLTTAGKEQVLTFYIDADNITVSITRSGSSTIHGIGLAAATVVTSTTAASDESRRGDYITLKQTFPEATAGVVSDWSVVAVRGKGWA